MKTLHLQIRNTEYGIRIHTRSKRGQLGEALFPRASHTDQQRMALHHPEHALDPGQVLQRVIKQHQLQLVVAPLVVLLHDLTEESDVREGWVTVSSVKSIKRKNE